MRRSPTIKSKWRDTPWVPEPGSKIGGMYTYTLNGITHHLGIDEQEAGERMGNESFGEYASNPSLPCKPVISGWEYFDQRPGIKDPNITDWDYIAKANTIWTDADIEVLRRMKAKNCSWLQCAVALFRTPDACESKWYFLSLTA